MKANELRIGNLVYPNDDNGTPYPVTEIRENTICCTNKGDEEYNWCMPEVVIGLGDIQPIELTEEWLFRFGFKKRKVAGFWFDYRLEYVVIDCMDGSEFDIYFSSLHQTKLEYVHQLQNLYFALTGEELEIKP